MVLLYRLLVRYRHILLMGTMSAVLSMREQGLEGWSLLISPWIWISTHKVLGKSMMDPSMNYVTLFETLLQTLLGKPFC